MITYEDNQLPKDIQEKLDQLGAIKTGSREMLDRYFMVKPLTILDGRADDSTLMMFSDELVDKIDDKTDWDYAVQYSEENLNLVRQLFRGSFGYFPMEYADTNSMGCFSTLIHSKPSILSPVRQYHIQIIFKKNMKMFKDVWKSTDLEYYSSFLWKRSKHYQAWNIAPASAREFIRNHFNAMYDAYKAGRDLPNLETAENYLLNERQREIQETFDDVTPF